MNSLNFPTWPPSRPTSRSGKFQELWLKSRHLKSNCNIAVMIKQTSSLLLIRGEAAHPASWTEFETSGWTGEQGSTAFNSITELGSPEMPTFRKRSQSVVGYQDSTNLSLHCLGHPSSPSLCSLHRPYRQDRLPAHKGFYLLTCFQSSKSYLVLVVKWHHELGVYLQLASRPLHGGLKHFQYHFRSQEIMMLKQIM